MERKKMLVRFLSRLIWMNIFIRVNNENDVNLDCAR